MKITLREWFLLLTICACVCWSVNLQQRLARSREILKIKRHQYVIDITYSDNVNMPVTHSTSDLQKYNPELVKIIDLVEADQRK